MVKQRADMTKKKSVYERVLELTEIQTGGHLLVEGKCIFHLAAFLQSKGFVQAGTDFGIEVKAEHVMIFSNACDVFIRLIQVNDPESLVSVEVLHFRDTITKEVLSMDRLYDLHGNNESLISIKDCI